MYNFWLLTSFRRNLWVQLWASQFSIGMARLSSICHLICASYCLLQVVLLHNELDAKPYKVMLQRDIHHNNPSSVSVSSFTQGKHMHEHASHGTVRPTYTNMFHEFWTAGIFLSPNLRSSSQVCQNNIYRYNSWDGNHTVSYDTCENSEGQLRWHFVWGVEAISWWLNQLLIF